LILSVAGRRRSGQARNLPKLLLDRTEKWRSKAAA
jgi:hypothetical protein